MKIKDKLFTLNVSRLKINNWKTTSIILLFVLSVSGYFFFTPLTTVSTQIGGIIYSYTCSPSSCYRSVNNGPAVAGAEMHCTNGFEYYDGQIIQPNNNRCENGSPYTNQSKIEISNGALLAQSEIKTDSWGPVVRTGTKGALWCSGSLEHIIVQTTPEGCNDTPPECPCGDCVNGCGGCPCGDCVNGCGGGECTYIEIPGGCTRTCILDDYGNRECSDWECEPPTVIYHCP